MTRTPEKPVNNSINRGTLTLVQFTDRQLVLSPASYCYHDASFAICRTRLAQILKQLQDNFEKWQAAHKNGLTVCTVIEAVKTRCLESLTPNDGSQLYPKDLHQYCDRLAMCVITFQDISSNTRGLLHQLHALNMIRGASNEIFYRSWRLSRFVIFVEQLEKRYTQETVVKQFVMREIAHCMRRSQLIACTTVWACAQHIDAYVILNFLLLAEEIRPGL